MTSPTTTSRVTETHGAGEASGPPGPQSIAASWRLLAWVSGAFSLLLGIAMLAGHLHSRSNDPLDSRQLKQLKEQLRQSPRNEPVKQEIRRLDLELRQEYFRQAQRAKTGGWMLVAGTAVFVLAGTRARNGRKTFAPLKERREHEAVQRRISALGRWSVAAAGSLAGGVLFLLSFGFQPALPPGATAASAAVAAAGPDAAATAELQRNWPRLFGFRSGYAQSSNAPAKWDPATGAGIAWRIPAPAPGFNSPIVWENRFFFSGGNPPDLEVFALSTGTGQIAWRQKVVNIPGSPSGDLGIPESTGYTAPTMATDGRRVYAVFANGDVAAFTLDGKAVWAKAFGPLENPYGHAISLVTWRDRLILQLDQGDSEAGKSKIMALDGPTGRVLWQKPRKVGGSWTTPLVFESDGKPQVVALAVPWAISYNVEDGAELWRVDCLNGEVTPSPIFAAGLVCVVSPSDRMLAIKPGGSGDVTKTHIAWQAEDNIPDVTSPATDGELIFAITTPGILTCYDAKDGKKQWEHDFEMDFHSSPVVAGGRVYLFSQKGTAFVAKAAREFAEIFRTNMEDSFHASPAFTPDDRIIVRGMSNIWCLAVGGASPGSAP